MHVADSEKIRNAIQPNGRCAMYYFMNKDDIVAFLDKTNYIWKLQYKDGALSADSANARYNCEYF